MKLKLGDSNIIISIPVMFINIIVREGEIYEELGKRETQAYW